MFIITDKCSFRVDRESCFSRSGKSEEYGCITIFTNIRRAVH